MPVEPYSINQTKSPIILNIPHAGRTYPGRPDLKPAIRLIADLRVDRIADMMGEHLPVSSIRSNMSRLWCDIERYPDEREEMNKVGMGVFYTVDADLIPLYEQPLSEEEKQHRLDTLYRPYHEALAGMCENALADYGHALLLDLHSYSTKPLPYELHKDDPRPDICIGHNDDGVGVRVAERFRTLLEEAGYTVGFNETFKGSIRPETVIDPRLACVMVEIRKDVYLDSIGRVERVKLVRLEGALERCVRDYLAEPVC